MASTPAALPGSAADAPPRIAVLIPCHNEAATIARTVEGFRRTLPDAEIVVGDNGSTDGTRDVCRSLGVRVVAESRLGKGWMMRRLFAEVDADLYVMSDGDATYSPNDAPTLLRALLEGGHDLVVGHRLNSARKESFRPGHRFGNRLFARLAKTIFQGAVDDLLSGYRVMTRRFVKTFPADSRGFEIETELTVFACEHRLSYAEVDVDYLAREAGSESKLNTIRDGFVIGLMLLRLFRDMRPMKFFGIFAAALFGLSVLLFLPILDTYLATGLVPRIPTLILIVFMDVAALLLVMIGIILEQSVAIRRYIQHLHYLSVPPTAWAEPAPSAKGMPGR